MKRRGCMMLIVAMLLLGLGGRSFAANGDTLVISANDILAEVGDQVVIVLRVEENPGFSAIQFYPSFSESAKNWSWKASNTNTELLNDYGDPYFTLTSGKQIMLDTQEMADCTATGILLELRVQIPEDAAPGVYTVAFCLSQCIDAEWKSVAVQLPAVTITVGCVHTNTVVTDAKLPSCVESGYTASIFCQDCKTYLSTSEPIPATGHNYGSAVTAPTCANDGFTAYTCANCGDRYTSDVVEKKGHVDEDKNHSCDVCDDQVGEHSDSAEDKDHLCDYGCGAALEACVDAAGDGNHDCDICGKEFTTEHLYSDPKCDQPGTCTECGTVTSDALGHSEVLDAAVAATCTTAGITEGKHCSRCETVLVAQTEIAALGHSEVIDAAVAATCSTVGLTEGKHCANCATVLVAQTEVAALGHNYGQWIVTKEATEDEEGTQSAACISCGDTKVEKIAKLQLTTQITSQDNQMKLEVDSDSTAQIDAGTQLVVARVEKADAIDETVQNNLFDTIDASAEVLAVYDIALMLDNVAVQPGGQVKITIPVPEEVDAQGELIVVYVADDGSVTACQTVRNDDGTLTFLTDHFSYYAVVAVSATQTPQKDNTLLYVACAAVVLAGAAVAAIISVKKRKVAAK